MSNSRSRIIALIGTILLMLLLFLFLLFYYIGAPIDMEDEGIEVAFGNIEQAGGYEERQAEEMPVEQIPTPSAPSAPSNNELLTQDDEESLALQRQQEKERREKEQAEADRLRREREERARAEAEAKAKAEAEARERARQAEAIAKANAMGSLFGNNGQEATGSGDTQGEGQKGNPVGHGNIGGTDWSLAGREAKAIPKPNNTFKQEGKVVVSIQVNAAGQVVAASLGSGSTISDQATIQLAIDAAKKAVFTQGNNAARGTITYTFRFN